MRKMRLSLCLLSAPARGWVTALFGAAGGAVPTRTWQATPGGQGEGDEAAGAAAGAAAEGRGRRPASERGGSLAARASLSLPLSRARLRPGWCRQNENVFCFVFLASPQQRYQPRLPPPCFLRSLPQPAANPLLQSAQPRCQGSRKNKKAKNTPWHPTAPDPRPLAAPAPNAPAWRLGRCLYISLFCPFSFLPPVGSLPGWVCVLLLTDPPPPVVLKPGRREPRAHFCPDAGVAGEGAGNGRSQEGHGQAGKSPGRKKTNPPPQAFCLTCVDAK